MRFNQNKFGFSSYNQKDFEEEKDHTKNTNSDENNFPKDNINYEEHPILKYFFSKNIKTKKLPCFEVYSSQIEILNQPMDFYLALIV